MYIKTKQKEISNSHCICIKTIFAYFMILTSSTKLTNSLSLYADDDLRKTKYLVLFF